MNKKWIFAQILYAFVATNLFAAASEPIQRIDVVNLLGTAGSATPSPVTLSFSNGNPAPCFTTTLQFQQVLVLWVGVGQLCTTAVSTLTITPLASVGGQGVIYDTPLIPTAINSALYSSQITVGQGAAPIFDPTNGGLLATGTVQVNVVGH